MEPEKRHLFLSGRSSGITAPQAGEEILMYRKAVHLEVMSVEAFFAFTRAVRTNHWYSGIEISPPDYRGKPTDGGRRVVTIWQGSRNSLHQRLEVHFFFNGDFGGWSINGLVFAGRSENGQGAVSDWSHAFRGGPLHDDEYSWRFIPVYFDGRHFKDIGDIEEFDRLYVQFFCHRQR